MKSYAARITLVLLLFSVLAVAVCNAVPRRGLTLLVAPSRYSVIQVAFDIVHRYGVALVSYEGDASSQNPELFAWNGMEWVKVSLQDYADCTFMQTAPTRTILIGGDDLLPPLLAEYAEGWSLEVLNIPSVRTADLVNSFANIFSFRKYDWSWFSQRYNLKLEDLNSARRKESWYDRQQYDDKWAHRWSWLRRKGQPQSSMSTVDEPLESIESVEPVEEQPGFITALSVGEEDAVQEVSEEEIANPDMTTERIGEVETTDVMAEDRLPPPFEETNAEVGLEDEVSSVDEDAFPEPAPVTGDMMTPAVQEDVHYEAVEETYPVK